MTTFDAVLFFVVLTLGTAAAWYAFAFAYHYRGVNWRQYAWGQHIMRFSIIIGATYALTTVLNVLAFFGIQHLRVTLILSLVLFGGAAYELRQRRNLEREQHRDRDEAAR